MTRFYLQDDTTYYPCCKDTKEREEMTTTTFEMSSNLDMVGQQMRGGGLEPDGRGLVRGVFQPTSCFSSQG